MILESGDGLVRSGSSTRRTSLAWAAALMASMIGAGCGGSGSTAAGDASALEVASGDHQGGIVGRELHDPVAVRVADAAGRPVAGQVVEFRVLQGGGSVLAGTAVSDRSGLASQRWTLGAEGDQKLEACVVDSKTGAVLLYAMFSAHAYASTMQLVLLSGGDQTGTVSAALPRPIVVQFLDLEGRGVGGQTVVVEVHGGGSVSAESVVTGVDGVGSITWRLGPVASSSSAQELDFGAKDSHGDPVPPLRVTATAVAGAPAAITLTPPKDALGLETVWPSWPDPAVIACEVVDANGNRVDGATVEFSASSGGTVSPASAVSHGTSRVDASWTFGEVAGQQTLRASAGGVTAVLSRDVTTDDMLDGHYVGTITGPVGSIPGSCGSGVLQFSVSHRRVQWASADDGDSIELLNGCFSYRSSPHESAAWEQLAGCLALDGAGGASGSGTLLAGPLQGDCDETWTVTRQ